MQVEIVLMVLCFLLLITFLWERRKHLLMHRAFEREAEELRRTSNIAGAVLRSVHAYILLIDNDFKVLKTNYYSRTGTKKGTAEKKVGDLLQCRNALSVAGGCGTHELCATCPVRCAIRNAFERKRDFNDLEATLNVYISDCELVECDTLISGTYLLLGGEDRMVLTVHDITKQKQAEHALNRD